MESEARFALEGMHCAACSSRIERVVGAMPGVREACVNLAAQSGKFVFDSQVVSSEDIKQAISRLGFTARPQKNGDDLVGQEKARAQLALQKKEVVFAWIFALPLLFVSMGHMWGVILP